jgi:hypothetical protein
VLHLRCISAVAVSAVEGRLIAVRMSRMSRGERRARGLPGPRPQLGAGDLSIKPRIRPGSGAQPGGPTFAMRSDSVCSWSALKASASPRSRRLSPALATRAQPRLLALGLLALGSARAVWARPSWRFIRAGRGGSGGALGWAALGGIR